MSGEQGIVRSISWRDLCPWLILFRALRLAFHPGLIALATVGALATPIGWRLSESAFLSDTSLRNPEFREFVERQSRWQHLPRPRTAGTSRWLERLEGRIEASIGSAAAPPLNQLTAPFRWFFSGQPLSLGQCLYLMAGTLWMLTVWGFVGGVLSRVAVVQYGWDEQTGLFDAAKLVVRRAQGLLLAPLFPSGAIGLLTAPCLLLGWLMRFDIGVFVGGILWLLVAVAGVLLALLVVGFAFGWPLMPVAVVAEEGGDQFEAFHRSYSYLFGRPLHFIFYVALALFLGAIGAIFIDTFLDLALRMSGWAVSWGTGAERWRTISDAANGGEAAGSLWAGSRLIGFVDHLVGTIAIGFRYSFFWCATAAIYLLLRQQVDEAEFDELYREEDEDTSFQDVVRQAESGDTT